MKSEEQLWFERWQNGDDRAFDALFLKFYKPLCYVAAIKIKDVHSAEDIVQDIFTDIFSKRDSLEISASIDKYLYGALFFKCLNYNKKRNINHSFDELSIDPKDIASIPSDKMEELELEAKIYTAIANLPEKCREVFELSRFKNKKNREIADMLNISIKTVETHVGIALKKLGSIFYEYLNLLILAIVYFFPKNF